MFRTFLAFVSACALFALAAAPAAAWKGELSGLVRPIAEVQEKAESGDMVFLVADERRLVRHVLGLLRLELGKPPVNEGGLNFLWIVDFPLFEALSDDGSPIPAHHSRLPRCDRRQA